MCMMEVKNESWRVKSELVKQGGGVGMILIDQFAKGVGYQFAIPGALMVPEEAKKLQAYMETEKYVPELSLLPNLLQEKML